MKRIIFPALLICSLLFCLHCASINKRKLNLTYSHIASRVYDLETRGIDANDLEKAYQEAGVPYSIRIFDEEGHGFREEARKEAREMTEKFLSQYLSAKNRS